MFRVLGGVALGAILAVMASAGVAQAKKITVLHIFGGGAGGGRVKSQMLLDPVGNLFGTTLQGGIGSNGVIFQVAPNGVESLLHAFTGDDGVAPQGGLVTDGAGNLFGTATQGGSSGKGTVFALAFDGQITVLHNFAGGHDGATPRGVLARDRKGNLYGTTEFGGVHGFGTVFEVAPSGKEKVLYAFTGGIDGSEPVSGLAMDSHGNLYGTTQSGGDAGGGTVSQNGAVFKLSQGAGKTWTESVLYTFQGGADGSAPDTGLLIDASGNLYGTTSGGLPCFTTGACGTVFKLAPNGVETVLHAFNGLGGSDGFVPTSLTMDKKRNLYGTTADGGGTGCQGEGCGTIFGISAAGVYSQLYAFRGTNDGDGPQALVKDANGNLFGATYGGGGDADVGLIFEIKRK